jgi:hypothetical protein
MMRRLPASGGRAVSESLEARWRWALAETRAANEYNLTQNVILWLVLDTGCSDFMFQAGQDVEVKVRTFECKRPVSVV